MDSFNMTEIEKILESIVLSYSKGMSQETVDNLFSYYYTQIDRLKKSLKSDKNNIEKRKLLNHYINILLQISNENTYLKNNINYERSISNKF